MVIIFSLHVVGEILFIYLEIFSFYLYLSLILYKTIHWHCHFSKKKIPKLVLKFFSILFIFLSEILLLFNFTKLCWVISLPFFLLIFYFLWVLEDIPENEQKLHKYRISINISCGLFLNILILKLFNSNQRDITLIFIVLSYLFFFICESIPIFLIYTSKEEEEEEENNLIQNRYEYFKNKCKKSKRLKTLIYCLEKIKERKLSVGVSMNLWSDAQYIKNDVLGEIGLPEKLLKNFSRLHIETSSLFLFDGVKHWIYQQLQLEYIPRKLEDSFP